MAENERLDVLKNKRWRRIVQCVKAGISEGEIVRMMGEALATTLRIVTKQLPIVELLRRARAGDPELRRLAVGCRHDFAELVMKISVETPEPGQSIAHSYVEAIFDRFADQICVELAGSTAYPTFDGVVAQSNRWKLQLSEEFWRLAECLETDGTEIRVRPQPAHVRAADRRRLADLSLLDREGKNR